MLSCPLATPSNALWLTNDHDRYWRRFYLAIAFSLGLHVAAVTGVWVYQFILPPSDSNELNSGAPNLPIQVQLITRNSRVQVAPAESEKIEKPAVVSTLAQSVEQTTSKPVEKINPQVSPKETKPVVKKAPITETKKSSELNQTAGATQKSAIIGASKTPVVTSAKPRYRSTPQQPAYPLQARKRKQEGVVVMHITVEIDGSISAVRVHQSSGYALLDNAAVKAARKWEMYPYEVNGQPTRAIFPESVKFQLS